MLYSASKARNLNFTAGIFKHASEAHSRSLFIIGLFGMKRAAGLSKITILTQKPCSALLCFALLCSNLSRSDSTQSRTCFRQKKTKPLPSFLGSGL